MSQFCRIRQLSVLFVLRAWLISTDVDTHRETIDQIQPVGQCAQVLRAQIRNPIDDAGANEPI